MENFIRPRPEFPKRAVITSGMPYGNKLLHYGHVGMTLRADVFARFMRDRIGKDNVIFVSGTDCYGSPALESYRNLKETGKLKNETIQEYVEKNHILQKEIFEKSKTKIEDLKTKIGKCNLAWRTLFANKTWDDIQLRASESKGRYTRKVEDEERLEDEPENARQEVDDPEIQAQIAETVRRIQQNKKQARKGENLPTKVTVWTKFKNFFKSIPAKFRETFGKVESSADPKKKAGKPAKTKTATEQQKDAFLESLRQHVDVEYRKEVREAKEQEYINKHKAQEQNQR